MDWKTILVKGQFPKIFQFTVPFKITGQYLGEISKLFLKFILRGKGTRIKKLEDAS